MSILKRLRTVDFERRATARADALFVEHGGESNPKAAAHCVMRALETAESLGVVRLVRPTDITVEKVKTK